MLPSQLPELTQAIDDPDLTRHLIETTVALYGDILTTSGPTSELDDPGLAPELTLKFAHSLAH